MEETSEPLQGPPAALIQLSQTELESPPECGDLVPSQECQQDIRACIAPVSQSQELCKVEDDGQQEEYQGVGQPRLRAEAELEAVDGRAGGVEERAGEDSLTLLASLNTFVDVRTVGPLGIVFYRQQRVEEDVKEGEADCRTEPSHEYYEPKLQSKYQKLMIYQISTETKYYKSPISYVTCD